MKISNIHVKNFKTFKDMSVDLNDFNIIIGECASGKSNFIEIFKFLKDLSTDFPKAISKHNRNFIQNSSIMNQEPTYIKIIFTNKSNENPLLPINSQIKDKIYVEFIEISYELSFNFNNINYEVLTEKVTFDFNAYKQSNELNNYKDNILTQNTLNIINNSGVIDTYFKMP